MPAIKFPRLMGEVHDKDTQFTAAMKNNQEIVLIVGLVLVCGLIYYIYDSFFNERTGTWRYALCRAFLEQYAQYPTDLEILTVAEKQNSAQIGYLATNSYGSQASELIECFYNTSQNNVSMSRVTVDRKRLALKNPVSEDQSRNTQPIRVADIQPLWERQNQSIEAMKYPGITLESFNKVIPVILSVEGMDLTIPQTIPNSLEDLKF